MLVISCKPAERIIVTTDTVIEVVEASADRVRLGVTAHFTVSVRGDEVVKRVANTLVVNGDHRLHGEIQTPFLLESK